ncbi:uncharacterized protein LOC116211924 [Punica granatum]|uniref:Uncharacterized protein LOC116211924 n=1 Tax=Punica granatum TaxID=22663 RepID=A0A6P8DXR8_PUNGR|nr:uncharacterized protein LOC116211924 [Punica granatum]
MDNMKYHGYILEIHHGGSFNEEGGEILYSGGEIMRWDIDPDKVSITHMVKELENMGYKGNVEVVLCRVHGKGLKEGLFEVYKDSSVIQLIGQLLEHKYCQLYVKHKIDPKSFQQPTATTEGGDEETASGRLRREGVDAIVDPGTEESEEDSSSGSESDIAYRDVAADLSEEDDPELEDIRCQVEVAKKKRAEKLKSLRLQKDLDTIIREARQDKQYNKGKGKEKGCAIVAIDAATEGYITDYPSSNEACSINSGESSYEFGDDEDTLREPRSYFRKSGTFPQYEPTCELPTFTVGQLFEDGKQFKDAICLAAVKTQRNIYFKKNCKEYIRVRCKETSCPWQIVAKFMKNLGAYQVRKFFDNHTCNITYKNSRVNSSWLAKHYMGTIRSLPSIKLNEFKKLVKEQLGVEVSRSQCRRAKEKVYDLVVGDSKGEYALM